MIIKAKKKTNKINKTRKKPNKKYFKESRYIRKELPNERNPPPSHPLP